jgi:hypothetical protein
VTEKHAGYWHLTGGNTKIFSNSAKKKVRQFNGINTHILSACVSPTTVNKRALVVFTAEWHISLIGRHV